MTHKLAFLIILAIIVFIAITQGAKNIDNHALKTCHKYNDCQEVINHINNQ
jgi:hypothetical protein